MEIYLIFNFRIFNKKYCDDLKEKKQIKSTLGVRLSVFLVTNAGLSYLTSDEVGAIILILTV